MGRDRDINDLYDVIHTFYLFFNWFRWVQPMLHAIRIGELQSEIVFLDKIQWVKHLLIQIIAHRFFLHKKKTKTKEIKR